MANDRVEEFLRAEDEAHRLVDQLSELKRETESYSTARIALQDAGSGIATLTDALAGAAQRLEEVVKTLRSIGTPELLRAQEATTVELASVRSALDATKAITQALQHDIGARDTHQRTAIQELQLQLTRIRRAVLWVGALVVAALGGLAVAMLLTRGG